MSPNYELRLYWEKLSSFISVTAGRRSSYKLMRHSTESGATASCASRTRRGTRAFAVESLCAEGLVKPVGRIRGFAEQEHRGDPPFDEPTRHVAEEKATNTLPVKSSQDINLVQFAG